MRIRGLLRSWDFWVGLFWSVVVPVLTLLILLGLNEILAEYLFFRSGGFRFRFWVMIAIAANLIPMHYFARNGSMAHMRGVLAGTFLEVTIFFIAYFTSPVFREMVLRV